MRVLSLAAALAGALLCRLAFAQVDIVVGQVVDLSGPRSYIGRDFSAGAKTYFD